MPSIRPVGLAILALLIEHSSAKLLQHSPEDTYAFPKYRVNFLNNHPVASDIAQVWLSDGLKDGVREFMGSYHSMYENDWPQLEASHTSTNTEPSKVRIYDTVIYDWHGLITCDSKVPHAKLTRIKLGSKRSYVCLVPPALEVAPREYEEPQPSDPAKSWQLLHPLSGRCIYHRQGWFTYSYCHNSHVRQFRETEHSHPHPPGGRIPQEDTEYHAYTLGQSPVSLKAGNAEVAVPENARPSTGDLKLSEGAGQRYLTSLWTDGTTCDKTGRPREVEIQFHCSMTTPDQIQFLKETSVCQYLMVIQTPRLCGEPGFLSARDKLPAAPIHCREILAPENMSAGDEIAAVYPEGPHPADSHTRNPIHLPNYALQERKKAIAKAAGARNIGFAESPLKNLDSVQKALEHLLGRPVKLAGLDQQNVAAQEALVQAAADDAIAQDLFARNADDNNGNPNHNNDGDQVFQLGDVGDDLWQALRLPVDGDQQVLVQLLDLQPGEEEDPARLLNRIQNALKSKKQQQATSHQHHADDQDDGEEEVLYYDYL
ncbi:Protein OS-9 [Tulasnella sp. 403]|nr:Protein OS-9 [Tulasnella sp. 403]